MSFSQTASRTDTYTEARLRAVMPEVGADFWGLAAVNIITKATAERWIKDVTFVLEQRCAKGFQIQLYQPGGPTIALDYRVSADGSIRESSTGGGIDYWSLAGGTTASLFIDLDFNARNIANVKQFGAQNGWGTGSAVGGDSQRDRAFSRDGYGVVRTKVGAWPA